MTICSKCGSEMSSDWQYCKACGSGSTKKPNEALQQKRSRVLHAEKAWLKPVVAGAGVLFVALSVWVVFEMLTSNTAPRGDQKRMASSRGILPVETTYTRVRHERGSIRIPVTELEGRTSRFYVYSYHDKDIKFFLVRDTNGVIRAALDTCNACYHAKLGYRQEGDGMICNNCEMSFPLTDVGTRKGGCNPVPLNGDISGSMIVLKAKEIEAGARFF